jgi:hypothetical protein
MNTTQAFRNPVVQSIENNVPEHAKDILPTQPQSLYSIQRLAGFFQMESKVIPAQVSEIIQEEVVKKPFKKTTKTDRFLEALTKSGLPEKTLFNIRALLLDRYYEHMDISVSGIQSAQILARKISDQNLESLRAKISNKILNEPKVLSIYLDKKIFRPPKPKSQLPYVIVKHSFMIRSSSKDTGRPKDSKSTSNVGAKRRDQLGLNQYHDSSSEESNINNYALDDSKNMYQMARLFNFKILSKDSLRFLKKMVNFYILDQHFNFQAGHRSTQMRPLTETEYLRANVRSESHKSVTNSNEAKRRTIQRKLDTMPLPDNHKTVLMNYRRVNFSLHAVDFSRNMSKPWIDKLVGIGMQPEEQGEMKKKVGDRFVSRWISFT